MTRDKMLLVVEDESYLRTILAMVLEDEGYSVQTASDGCDALAKANERHPHAILLDLVMPEMDGWEFLARWFAQAREPHAPILIMSAVDGRQRARDLGATDFLAKPFDLDVLLTKLASVL